MKVLPQLTEKKVLRKLLQKSFGQNNSHNNLHNNSYYYGLSTKMNSLCASFKENWYIIIIIIFLIIILIHLYLDNKKRKQKKELEEFEMSLRTEQMPVETFKGSYESEYYKMLPRVTNSPNVIPYQY